jgi:hypothetical protein
VTLGSRIARPLAFVLTLALPLTATAPAGALDLAGVGTGGSDAAPRCAAHDPLRRPFFGDTHVHTARSQDASTQGTRTTPMQAYDFARGEPLGIQPWTEDGQPLRTVRIDRPLDFAAVTDHAEQFGEVHICNTPGAPGNDSLVCQMYRHLPRVAFFLMNARASFSKERWSFCGEDDIHCLTAARGVWQEMQEAAEGAYDRSPACRFTSFVAYEWTASIGAGTNLHRNVIFRGDRVPGLPISWIETASARELWDHLQRECVDGIAGCDVLTIPHNSNLSAGLMFESADLNSSEGRDLPVDAEDARLRARWEPLAEIMQHKGDSECFLTGDTTDEACGFEKLPWDTFGAQRTPFVESGPQLPISYVRGALKRGLVQHAELGVNGLRFGIVAATDTHLGTPGLVAEDGYPGHGGAGTAGNELGADSLPDVLEFGPGGLAVVWAEENQRDSLFDAMQRREVYGTSGTRPEVRLFAGFDLDEELCEDPAFVAKGYETGVPMGGELPEPAEGAALRVAVSALRDPGTNTAPGMPLQRIQLVKGWVADGTAHEQVLDVAGGPNEAGVDTATCTPHGEGHDRLCSVWTDPDFDPTEPAFYYARVLENPTCRWSQHLCVERDVDCSDPASVPEGLARCCAPDHVKTIQERAWTSPVWVLP